MYTKSIHLSDHLIVPRRERNRQTFFSSIFSTAALIWSDLIWSALACTYRSASIYIDSASVRSTWYGGEAYSPTQPQTAYTESLAWYTRICMQMQDHLRTTGKVPHSTHNRFMPREYIPHVPSCPFRTPNGSSKILALLLPRVRTQYWEGCFRTCARWPWYPSYVLFLVVGWLSRSYTEYVFRVFII